MKNKYLIMSLILLGNTFFLTGCRGKNDEQIIAQAKAEVEKLKSLEKGELSAMCKDLCDDFDNTGERCYYYCETGTEYALLEYIRLMKIAKLKGLEEMPGY